MKKQEFLIQDLVSKIYQNQFASGKLPNQRALAASYGVSRYTVQAALKHLQEMGIIRVVQGSGIFVHEQWVKSPLIYNSLTQTPYERINSKVVTLSKGYATMEEQQIFQLSAKDEVWHFERLRIVNYKIEQIERSVMPVYLFPVVSPADVEGSMQQFVEAAGYRISHYLTSYEPTLVQKAEAALLHCRKGEPAMQIKNRGLLEDGRVYAYSEITALDYSATYIRPFDREIHQARSHRKKLPD